jgi:hypothetical protein
MTPVRKSLSDQFIDPQAGAVMPRFQFLVALLCGSLGGVD